MTFLQRFGYYLGGFSVGLIILAFFLSGKKTSCAYGPNARTIKNISNKERLYSEIVSLKLHQKEIDTATISKIIRYGTVDFSESNVKLDSCKIYVINTEISEKNYKLTVENCETKATILSIE